MFLSLSLNRSGNKALSPRKTPKSPRGQEGNSLEFASQKMELPPNIQTAIDLAETSLTFGLFDEIFGVAVLTKASVENQNSGTWIIHFFTC